MFCEGCELFDLVVKKRVCLDVVMLMEFMIWGVLMKKVFMLLMVYGWLND